MTRLRAGSALCLLALTIVTVESVKRPSVARKPPRAPRRQEEPLAQAGEEPLGQGEGEVKPQPAWLKMEAADPNLQQPGSGAVADEDEDAGEVQELAPELPDATQAEGGGEGAIQDLDVEGTGGPDGFPSTRCSAGVNHTTQATLPDDADDESTSPADTDTDTTMTPVLATTTTTRAPYIGPGAARPPDHYLDDV